MQNALILQVGWAVIIWAVKGCLMCMYYDIGAFAMLPRRIHHMMLATSALVAATFFVALGINLLWCVPFATQWVFSTTKCSASALTPLVIVGATHIATDCMGASPGPCAAPPPADPRAPVFAIPVLIFRHAPLKRTDVSAFVGICLIGVLTVAVGAVATAVRIRAHHGAPRPRAPGLFLEAERVAIARVQLASIAECACAILLVCLPTARAEYWRRRHARMRAKESAASSARSVGPLDSYRSAEPGRGRPLNAYLEMGSDEALARAGA